MSALRKLDVIGGLVEQVTGRSRGVDRGRDVGRAAVAVAAAGAAGLLAAWKPAAGLVLIGASAYLAIAVARPHWLAWLAIIVLGVNFPNLTSGKLADPQVYKEILYALLIPLALRRGLAGRRLWPLLALLAATLLSLVLGSRLPGLSNSNVVDSLASLALVWLVLSVRWRWEDDWSLLAWLAVAASVSILIGLGEQAAGVHDIIAHGTPGRLEGATIPAWLAPLGLTGALAARLLWLHRRWRPGLALCVLDIVICAATVTRGAIIALVIALIPTGYLFLRARIAEGRRSLLVVLVSLLVVGGAVAAVIPSINARRESTIYTPGVGVTRTSTSGRAQDWSYVIRFARVNLAFGRVTGAGPLVGKARGAPHGFTAQHNEYLRSLLEVGIVGTVLTVLGAMAAFRQAIRETMPGERLTAAALAVAFAIYSFTDNTLSAPQLGICLMLVVAMLAASGQRRRAEL